MSQKAITINIFKITANTDIFAHISCVYQFLRISQNSCFVVFDFLCYDKRDLNGINSTFTVVYK